MATVIYGNNSEFNYLAFGEKDPGTTRFLQDQLQATPSHYLTDAGKAFFADSHAIYERFNGAEALRLAAAATARVRGIFQPHGIRAMWDLSEIQNATPEMQRWIMAEPVLRTLFHQQRADGYTEGALGSYEDVSPGQIGRHHYDYQQATQGMVIVDEEKEEWHHTTYLDPLEEGDRPRTMAEKVDILTVWDMVEYHIERGDDPSSSFGGKL